MARISSGLIDLPMGMHQLLDSISDQVGEAMERLGEGETHKVLKDHLYSKSGLSDSTVDHGITILLQREEIRLVIEHGLTYVELDI